MISVSIVEQKLKMATQKRIDGKRTWTGDN